MRLRKAICTVTAAAVLMGSFAGCSLLNGKDKEAIVDVVGNYLDAIKKGKYNNSKKYVVDEEDYFQDNALEAQQAELVEAVLNASEFEFGEAEVNKNSGSVEVTIVMPDLGSIADEGYTFDEFISNIGDIDDTVDETIEFECSKDGDEWLVEGDSTEDFFNFCESIGEGIEFGGLSEAAALETVDTFLAYLAAGELQSAIDMSNSGGDLISALNDEFGESVDPASLQNVFQAYFSNMSYETEVTNVTDDEITVALTGMAPDSQAGVVSAVNNYDIMVPVYADYLETVLNGQMDYGLLFNGYLIAIADGFAAAPLADYSATFTVSADADGNLMCDPGDGFINWDFNYADPSDELVYAALDYLLEQGRISQADYNLLVGSTSTESDADINCVEVEEGEDLYIYNYTCTSSEILLTAVTWDYYDQGTEFAYEIAVNGTENAMSGTYIMPQDGCDQIDISIPLTDGASGTYEITIHDADSRTVLVDLEFIFITEGAPLEGNIEFGPSMSYEEVSDDFYSFHFLDGNGEWVSASDDTYAGNRGAVDFCVRTWAYYGDGEEMSCDVYMNGALMQNLTAEADPNATDTFYFTYEPGMSLPDGDYTFVMYDVEETTVLCIAYATVESVD